MNTKSLFIALALTIIVGATGLVAYNQNYQNRSRRPAETQEVEVKDAGLLGEGGLLGTGLGADRNVTYQRRVPYYRNPNAPEAVSNVATGVLDTAGAVLPWNWGKTQNS